MAKERNGITINIGSGLFGFLTLLFIGLKLTGNIAWSWLWVLSPLWLPLAVVLGILILALILAVLVEMLSHD